VYILRARDVILFAVSVNSQRSVFTVVIFKHFVIHSAYSESVRGSQVIQMTADIQ